MKENLPRLDLPLFLCWYRLLVLIGLYKAASPKRQEGTGCVGAPTGSHPSPIERGPFWHSGFFPSQLYCPAPCCCVLFQSREGFLPWMAAGQCCVGLWGCSPAWGGNFFQLRWALLGPSGTSHGVKLEPSAAPHAPAHLYALSHHTIHTPCHHHLSFVFFYFRLFSFLSSPTVSTSSAL